MASIYEEGLQLIDEKFGNGKDNIISLATIARESSADGNPRPVVRCVDAYYEDCTFYVVTYGKSNENVTNRAKCGGFSCSLLGDVY